MTLSERVARAQQAATEAAKAAGQPSAPPAGGPPVVGTAPAGHTPAGNPPATSTALVPIPVAPAPPPAPRNLARDELLHEIRVGLQGEVVSAFDTLLDVPPAEVRSKVEAIVDRVTAANGFAVTATSASSWSRS